VSKWIFVTLILRKDICNKLFKVQKSEKAETPPWCLWLSLERLFARGKKIKGIDDDKDWSKRLPWKQLKYDRDKKSHEAMQKLKGPLHVASRSEWQLDYKTQDGLRQYYSTTQRELYGEKYPNPLRSLLRVWSTGNIWARSQGVSFAFCREKLLEESFSGVWYQEGPWRGSHVLRFITATFCWWFAWLEQLVEVWLSVNL
jgi:hypothetical protein